MDFQIIRAFCANDLQGKLNEGHSWMYQPGDRWHELNFIVRQHSRGGSFLNPRDYAAAVCMRDVEAMFSRFPWEPSAEFPDLTEEVSTHIQRIILTKSLEEYLTHFTKDEAAPLSGIYSELQAYSQSATHLYPNIKIELPFNKVSPAPFVQATETKEQRQDRRLKACIDAGLPMHEKAAISRLPDGVAKIAKSEGVTRQSFSTDVKAALERQKHAKREGVTVHRT